MNCFTGAWIPSWDGPVKPATRAETSAARFFKSGYNFGMSLAVSLVIVTHNSAAWLAGLASSLEGRAASGADSGSPEIIVADSGSTDQTLCEVRRLLPGARLIECENIGFGAAANRAIQRALGEWVLLCNPDLEFGPDFFREFLAAAESHFAGNPRIACFAPTLLNADGSIQPSVGRFPTIAGILRDQFRPRWKRKYLWPPPIGPGVVDWATAACLLVRRDAFLQVGGFDEKYFLYGEDVDLQRRLKEGGFLSV